MNFNSWENLWHATYDLIDTNNVKKPIDNYAKVVIRASEKENLISKYKFISAKYEKPKAEPESHYLFLL